MEPNMLTVAFWCALAVAFVLLLLFMRERHVAARLRGRNTRLEEGERVREDELRHLTGTRLPALMEYLFDRPIEVPGPRSEHLSGTPYAQELETVMSLFGDTVERAKSRADQSAKATLKTMMRGVQSLASEQELSISQMQERHDDPDVLDGLLKIDHMNAQLGRRAQATAVLCGSWPGQQRSASALTDVVRGATSRIRDYLRIRIHSQVNVAVVSRVVEPVVLAVAELLDNAARHSQPNSSVEVNFQPAHNGIAIVIDDAGVAMNPEELKRAGRLLAGRDSIDINRLGDPPQVGFAVVGVLAARYGFTVSVDTRSPYGGVRAVVFLPNALLTKLDNRAQSIRVSAAPGVPVHSAPATPSIPDMPTLSMLGTSPYETEATVAPLEVEAAPGPPGSALPVAPAADADRLEPESEAVNMPVSEAPSTRSLTAGGLPKRRRERPADGDATDSRPADIDGQAPVPYADPVRSARDVAAGMGAWQRGSRSGRDPVSPESEGNPQA